MMHLFLLLIFLIIPLISKAEEDNPDLRIELARASLYLQMNEREKAFQLLSGLKAKYPDNPDVLSAEAEAYLDTGYRGRGLVLLDNIFSLDPDNEEAGRIRENALLVETPFIATEANSRFTGDSLTEHITRISGSRRYLPHLAMGAAVEREEAKASWITRLNGTTEPFDGTAMRGEIYGSYNFANGDQSTLSLFPAEGVLGAGAWYSWYDNRGVTDFEALLQRSDWEFIEQVINKGRKDVVKISRSEMLTPRLQLTASAALNRYGLGSDNNIANSPSFYVDANYLLPPCNNLLDTYHINVRVDYALDAEYPFYVENKVDVNGNIFDPLPLESREVHIFTATVNQTINTDLSYELFGGYAYDRLGGGGPLTGIFLTWWPLQKLAIEVNASRSIRKELTSDSVDNMGIKARLVF